MPGSFGYMPPTPEPVAAAPRIPVTPAPLRRPSGVMVHNPVAPRPVAPGPPWGGGRFAAPSAPPNVAVLNRLAASRGMGPAGVSALRGQIGSYPVSGPVGPAPPQGMSSGVMTGAPPPPPGSLRGV